MDHLVMGSIAERIVRSAPCPVLTVHGFGVRDYLWDVSTKLFKLGSRARLQANVDMYNFLNTNAIQGVNGVYLAQWLQPSGSTSASPGAIVDGRLVEVSGTLRF